MKTYNGILIVGDSLISGSRPGRRLDTDFMQTAISKVAQCIAIAQERNLKLIFNGAITRKNFEIGVFSKLIHLFSGKDVLVVAGDSEYKPKSLDINPHSTCKLLSDSGIIKLAEKGGIAEKILISTTKGIKSICLYAVPEGGSTPANIGLQEGINRGDTVFILSRLMNEKTILDEDDGEQDIRLTEWPGASYYVTNRTNQKEPIRKVGRTTWLHTGPLVRTHVREAHITPCAWEWNPETDFNIIEINHSAYIFDDSGFASKSTSASYKNSEFTRLLKDESKRASLAMPTENFIEAELANIYQELKLSIPSREIIDSYIRKTETPSNILDGVF